MPAIQLLIHLLPGELHLLSIDDDDEITGVNVRCELGLVLTPQDSGDFRR